MQFWAGHSQSRGTPNLDLRDPYLRFKTLFHLRSIRALEEKVQGINQVVTRFLNGGALACDIVFRAERRLSTLFALDNDGQTSQLRHGSF